MRDRTIKRTELVRLLLAATPTADQARHIDFVETTQADELVIRPVTTRDLRVIYRRRRARLPQSHPLSASVDRLLAALATYNEDEVNLVSFEGNPEIHCAVWLTGSADAVLSIMISTGDR
ncbi:hypothetical protein [Arthrobacter glacialis]|uniref:hypothetical protein n=1 Tax=Arthrobacter glacialis TaxID=1664 RepID=UPI000CD456E2|nr:hypothetical protein [Arthrobacter glacialis]POH57704.1 hypothetical protein CVS28_14390 [Arthrobacter glacialis]